MIEHVWTVLCENSVIDKDTNNLSLHNVIEGITIYGEPTENGILPIKFELVTLWVRSEINTAVKGKSRVTLISPSEKEHSAGEQEIDLETARRSRNRIIFQSIPVEERGIFHFRLEINFNEVWQTICEIPLEILFETNKEPQSIT